MLSRLLSSSLNPLLMTTSEETRIVEEALRRTYSALLADKDKEIERLRAEVSRLSRKVQELDDPYGLRDFDYI